MPSDDIIEQIIRTVVNESSRVLKAAAEKNSNAEEILDSTENQNPSTEVRTINEIFLAGIDSRVKPYQVTDTLAAFMIRSVALNPQYQFTVSKEMSREEVDRLIDVLHIH